MKKEDIRKRAETLRFRAEEARVCASAMSDPACRAALESMASSYEALAISLENSIEADPHRWTRQFDDHQAADQSSDHQADHPGDRQTA